MTKSEAKALRKCGIEVNRDHVKHSGFSAQERAAYFARGKAAFAEGRNPAPALNQAFTREVCALGNHDQRMAAMTLYQNGWTRANLDAPLPE